MKKFFYRLSLFIIPAVIIVVTLIALPPSAAFKRCLLYSVNDKNKLLETTPSPRIIFIGGSNLCFGLNSQMIKDSLKLNPVNTSIHVGLGLKYMLSNTEGYIKENDIVVIAPEYQQFFGELANGSIELLSLVVEVSPKSLSLLDGKQDFALLQNMPEYLKSKWQSRFKPDTDTAVGIYDRKSFNMYGDTYTHWKLKKEEVLPFGKIDGRINNDLISSLNKFRKIVNEKKATLYVTFPCYQDLSFVNAAVQIHEIENVLKKNGFNLISTPETYSIPDSLVFNTPYHLTKGGVDLRTTYLIEDLKKALHKTY